jgi:hypothetical protein
MIPTPPFLPLHFCRHGSLCALPPPIFFTVRFPFPAKPSFYGLDMSSCSSDICNLSFTKISTETSNAFTNFSAERLKRENAFTNLYVRELIQQRLVGFGHICQPTPVHRRGCRRHITMTLSRDGLVVMTDVEAEEADFARKQQCLPLAYFLEYCN